MTRIPLRPIRWELERVISGGQVGADIAGVRAAKSCGIKTAGHMPLGFLTLTGMRPEYEAEFGMKEIGSRSYAHRTEVNAAESDGTIRIAYRWNSPGERCTLRAIEKHGKPYLDIDPGNPLKPRRVALWIAREGIRVLNIAGNSDPNLEPFVESYLVAVFRRFHAYNQ